LYVRIVIEEHSVARCGGELLSAWRERHEVSQTDLAMAIRAIAPHTKADASTICHYERGRRLPRLAIAVAIERVTGGEVPCASWLDPIETDLESAA
jgi:predicted transcriptional regulator